MIRSVTDNSYDLVVFPLISVSLLLFLAFVMRWDDLKEKERKAAFREIFGIDMSDFNNRCAEECNAEERADIQNLVNRVLRYRAQRFHDARKAQELHFKSGDCADPGDARKSEDLQWRVFEAKSAFWTASDLAKYFRFAVKVKYTEWLEEPSVER